MLISSGKVQKKYGICRITLRSWVEKGLLKSYETPGGHYRYIEADVKRILGLEDSL